MPLNLEHQHFKCSSQLDSVGLGCCWVFVMNTTFIVFQGLEKFNTILLWKKGKADCENNHSLLKFTSSNIHAYPPLHLYPLSPHGQPETPPASASTSIARIIEWCTTHSTVSEYSCYSLLAYKIITTFACPTSQFTHNSRYWNMQ